MKIAMRVPAGFATLTLVGLSSAVLAGCPSDEEESAGSVDTSTTQYCSDYVAMCPNDSLRSVKEEACLEECTMGVKVAAASVRDSACWKAACSLELGVCDTFSSDEAHEAYLDQISACAMRHGWYEE